MRTESNVFNIHETNRIAVFGGSGGVGTTTIAFTIALAVEGELTGATSYLGERLRWMTGQQRDIPPEPGSPKDGPPVLDCGVLGRDVPHYDQIACESLVLVLRGPSYESLRGITQTGLADVADAIVLIHEPVRSLTIADAEAVLGRQIDLIVDQDPAVARSIDAGLIQTRRPKVLDCVTEWAGEYFTTPADYETEVR